MIVKFHDPVQLKLEAICVQLQKTLLTKYDRLPEKTIKMMVIHSGTSDITNKINTMHRIIRVIRAVIENDVNGETEIVLPSVIHR